MSQRTTENSITHARSRARQTARKSQAQPLNTQAKADTTKSITSQTDTEQKSRHSEDSASVKKHLTDNAFIREASQTAQIQIKLGELASLYGGTSAIRTFGREVVAVHKKASLKLKNKFDAEGTISLDSVCARCDAKSSELSSKVGSAFDEMYVPFIISEHQRFMQLLKDEQQYGDDRTVQTWATSMLPVYQRELRKAQLLVSARKKYDTSGY